MVRVRVANHEIANRPSLDDWRVMTENQEHNGESCSEDQGEENNKFRNALRTRIMFSAGYI